MSKLEQKLKKYIKDNTDVDFDRYLKNQLKDKKTKKLYNQEMLKLELAMEVYRARQKKKITQVQLAKNIKMPQANIARIEQGEHLPTLGTLSKIFNALGERLTIRIGRKEVCLGG